MLFGVFFVALLMWVDGSPYFGMQGEPEDKSSFRVDYQYYPKAEGWLKMHRIPVTWSYARHVCYLEGAYLASPITEGVFTVMRNLAQQARLPIFHIGVHSLSPVFSIDDYYSIEGIHLSQIPVTWAEGEPDNVGGKQNCLAMTPQGAVADTECTNEIIRPFFCYKKKEGFLVMNECGYHDKEYVVEPDSGHCYKYHTDRAGWYTAVKVCAGEGGKLAIINSEAEAQFLVKLSVQKKQIDWAYIGFYNEWGQWRTLEGQTLKEAGYEKWRQGEPNNLGGNENCGTFGLGSNASNLEFNDNHCDPHYPFVCEIPPLFILRK